MKILKKGLFKFQAGEEISVLKSKKERKKNFFSAICRLFFFSQQFFRVVKKKKTAPRIIFGCEKAELKVSNDLFHTKGKPSGGKVPPPGSQIMPPGLWLEWYKIAGSHFGTADQALASI